MTSKKRTSLSIENAVQKNHALQDYLQELLGPNLNTFLSVRPEPRSVRANTLKRSADYLKQRLESLSVPFKAVPFTPDGFILPEDPLPLSHTLDFFCGYLQYQGISSQIPPLVLNTAPDEIVLDISAAPGSKSTQIAALMKNRGLLYLNDVSRARLKVLSNNIQKAGSTNNVLTYLAGERFGNLFPEFFDKILLDAPCTAIGTLAQNPEIASWWSRQRFRKIIDLQKRLFISAFKALKIGGEMVYSTCSIAPEENELLVDELLRSYPMEIIPFSLPGFTEFSSGLTSYKNQKLNPDLKHAVRILPHKHHMEGFFIVKLRKFHPRRSVSPLNEQMFLPTLSAEEPPVRQKLEELSGTWGIPFSFWLDYRFVITKNRIWIVNRQMTKIPGMNLSSAGLLLSERKLSGWKLFNQSVQFLENQISARRLSLSSADMKRLFAKGSVCVTGLSDGYYVLDWEKIPRASVFVNDGNLKIKLPHRFNLVL